MSNELTPHEFFWPDPNSPNEKWQIGDPWLCVNPVGYVDLSADKIRRISIQLTDNESGESQKIDYDLWAGSQNYTSLVTWNKPGKPLSIELIHVNELPFEENCSHILRIDLSADWPSTTMNTIMHGRNGDEFVIDLTDRSDADAAG